MSSDTRTIDQLCISPFNARTNAETSKPTNAFKRSILRRGILMPLLIHPMPGQDNLWGVYAGGRRYRSTRELIEEGALPTDYQLPVIASDLPEADLIEISTIENLIRKDLLPYEVFAAIVGAHGKGHTEAQIAETIGQDVDWVRQSLRLGNLAEPIFQALQDGEIDVEQARAYGATADHGLQLATFRSLQGVAEHLKTPAKVRAAMKVGDGETERLLRFVGVDAYVKAGGMYELDLFDELRQRGLVRDEELLARLTHERLGGLRESIRVRTGRPGLRFAAAPPQNGYGQADGTLRVTPQGGDRDDGPIVLPEGDVVGFIKIGEDGKPDISFWWESTRAKYGHRTTPRPAGAPAPTATSADSFATPRSVDAALREEAGVSSDTIQALRSVRKVIMRAGLVDDATRQGDVATDFLVWSQLRIKLGGNFAVVFGIGELSLPHDSGGARDLVAGTDAMRSWSQALYELQQQSFFIGKDLVEAFADYRASPASLKRLAGAVVVGLALERSINADGYSLPMHDALAAQAGFASNEAVRASWAPSAPFLDLFSKEQRLAIARPFVEAATFGPWSRMKSAEVTRNVLDVLLGTAAGMRDSMKGAAARWVHPMLRFTPEGPDEGADKTAAELEAAE